MKRTIIAAAIVAVLVAAGGSWLYGELDRTQSSLRTTEAQLHQESATLVTTQDDLYTTVVRLNDAIATLSQTQADLGAERLTRNRLQEDKTALVADNAALTGSLRAANTENAALTEANASLTDDLAVAEVRETQLETRLATEAAVHTETKTVLASLEAEHAEVTKTANEFIALYGDVEALRREIVSLREQRRPLLLKTQRDALACTGSMEPKLTCLDEVTFLRNYAPADITIGTTVVFQGEKECVLHGPTQWLFGNRYRPCLQYLRPLIIHRVLEIGTHSYLTKGDASRENDGWIPVDDVVGYVIEVHRNVNPENARLRDAVNDALARLDSAEQALDVAEARWDAKVNEYCGVNVGCQVFYYDESDPIYIIYQQYRQAYAEYSKAFDTYECWIKNAEDSQHSGHIPRSCN